MEAVVVLPNASFMTEEVPARRCIAVGEVASINQQATALLLGSSDECTPRCSFAGGHPPPGGWGRHT